MWKIANGASKANVLLYMKTAQNISTLMRQILAFLMILTTLVANVSHAETTQINMLAPDRIKSYQSGGLTYNSITDFFEALPGYSVKFHYVDFAKGWQLIAKGENYCHFFAVYWPTDKNVVQSKKLTLTMRSPKILITKQTLDEKGHKPPYHSWTILQNKQLVGAMIRDHRFEYNLHQWLVKQVEQQSDHITTADVSVDQMYEMFIKKRLDFLIISPDTAIFVPPKLRATIQYIPFFKGQQSHYPIQLVCSKNPANQQFVKIADANMSNLYNNADWQKMWGYLHFHQADRGQQAMQSFIKQNR